MKRDRYTWLGAGLIGLLVMSVLDVSWYLRHPPANWIDNIVLGAAVVYLGAAFGVMLFLATVNVIAGQMRR